ncbi:uncharacterized protein C8A04DRAFT_38034 [Dichotomopilus funicola]|uniref:Uncharacterized protein n=1 Tax=Dichotomopilus funicola TaxID=1934379 RepID=A0AAN6ZKP3_9PEZI|nr:hypothetical protein C8A04DRAFT_38034 [Dichotomopilus funicola]
MYRKKQIRWKLIHLWTIIAHLGLLASAATSYIYDLGRHNSPYRWEQSTAANMHSCGSVRVARLDSRLASDTATPELLRACLVIGSLGLTLNVVILAMLLAVEPNRIMLTEGEQHSRKQIATFFSCSLNLLLVGVGVCLAASIHAKVAGCRLLIPPLILVYIQIPLTLLTAICDATKNYREGKDLLD